MDKIKVTKEQHLALGSVLEHIAPLICIGALLEETPNKTVSLNSLMDDVNLLIDKKYTQYKELFETEE